MDTFMNITLFDILNKMIFSGKGTGEIVNISGNGFGDGQGKIGTGVGNGYGNGSLYFYGNRYGNKFLSLYYN
jgi:hypothetical protein